jgi:hypothetical protein
LRATVLSDMYGDELTKEQKRIVYKESKFKQIYRRRKKNSFVSAQKPILKESPRQQRILDKKSAA